MDFLTFKSFISTEVLIAFYYLGALIFPIGVWRLLIWSIRKYKVIETVYKDGKEIIWTSLSSKQQTKLVALFIISFIFMELFWRMFFEFLIAYMQMRDALLQV